MAAGAPWQRGSPRMISLKFLKSAVVIESHVTRSTIVVVNPAAVAALTSGLEEPQQRVVLRATAPARGAATALVAPSPTTTAPKRAANIANSCDCLFMAALLLISQTRLDFS